MYLNIYSTWLGFFQRKNAELAHMKRKNRVFTSLSRRKRRAKTREIKNLIHRERHHCGGIFYDECDIDETFACGNWKWSNILFLGTSSESQRGQWIVTVAMGIPQMRAGYHKIQLFRGITAY